MEPKSKATAEERTQGYEYVYIYIYKYVYIVYIFFLYVNSRKLRLSTEQQLRRKLGLECFPLLTCHMDNPKM